MKHILLVDDDMFIRDLVATKLAQAYSVSTAATATEGIASVALQKPDLILLDLDLPDKHGLEVLTTFKKDIRVKSVPVIIFSNNDDSAMKQQLMAAGAADFYLKVSLDMNELKIEIDKFLS